MILFILLLSYTFDEPMSTSKTLQAGKYKVHCNGAQGGTGYKNGNLYKEGGKGAYVEGIMSISGTGTTFYINVGGMGLSNKEGGAKGGYNGGGNAGADTGGAGNDGPGGGGGATDIRINSNDLNDRIMVAAGGSGAAYDCSGAPGGALSGRYAYSNNNFAFSSSVTQSLGNIDGKGSNGKGAMNIPGSGGGGGWRGGLAPDYAILASSSYKAVAESGSSYISGYTGCVQHKSIAFTDGKMSAGQNSGNGKLVIDVLYECSNQCLKCTSENWCIECSTNYFLYDNGTQQECVNKCPDGYIGLNGMCKKCTSNCATCEGKESTCVTCEKGYYFHEKKCLSQCPSHYTEIGSKCEHCDNNCGECSITTTNCTSCKAGHYLYNNACVEKCPDGYIPLDGKCEKCISNCKTCKNYLQFCTSCEGDYYYYFNQCRKKCPDGYYGANNKCEKCKDGCSKCTDSEVCTECSNGFNLEGNKCVKDCQEGYFSNNRKCDKCSDSCGGCKVTSETCTSCKEGTYLYNNKCIKKCPEGTSPFSGKCESCDLYCGSCKGTPSYCTSCIDDDFIFDQEAGKCTPQCEGSVMIDGNCTECDSHCSNCAHANTSCNPKCGNCMLVPDICTSCKNGDNLLNYQCFSGCPPHFTKVGNKCEPCTSQCSECGDMNTSSCDSCISGYYLHGKDCLSECPEGFYGSNQRCESCNSLCKECTSADQCTSCIDSYNLYGSECINSCPKGTTSIDGVCESCTDNCETCKDKTSTCMSCGEGYNLYEEKCQTSCPTGTTSIDRVCEQCDTSCKECSSSATMCIECEPGKFLYEHACYDSCPNGTIENGDNCDKCDESCKECESKVDQCTVCTDGYYKLGTSCYYDCALANDYANNFYYGSNNETLTCERCVDGSCTDCSANYQNCTKCDWQHVVENNECYPPDYVVLVDSNCSHVDRCNYSVYKPKSVQVVVLVHTNFSNKDQELPGGAFYITDCAVSCSNTLFYNCISHGAGGAIYIKNTKELENNIDLQLCTFFKCSALYGGAVYLYSSHDPNNATIHECKFYSNSLIDNSYKSNDGLFGGAACFLTLKNADIQKCVFENNKGRSGAVKIFDNFDDVDDGKSKSVRNADYSGSITFSNCDIKMSPTEKSAIFVEGKHMSNVEIKNCNFKGKPAKGGKYIDGELLPKNAQKIQVNNCLFESNDKSLISINIKDEDN